jgi:hypothetical protein
MLSYQDKIIDIILNINKIVKIYCFDIDKKIKFKEDIYDSFFDKYDSKITDIFNENSNNNINNIGINNIGINKIIFKKILKQYYFDKKNKLKKIEKYNFEYKLEADVFLDLYISKKLDYKELLSLIYPYCQPDNFFVYFYQYKEYFFKIYQLILFFIIIYYLIT